MTFRLKTILGIASIEAILLVALLSMTLDYLETTNYNALTARAASTVNLFAATTKEGVLSYDLASLESFVSEVLKNSDYKYARVLGAQGELFASDGDEQALKKIFKEDVNVEDVKDGVYDVYALITEGSVTYGRVELGVDVAPIVAIINEAKTRSVFIALVEMLLVALFSFILGTYLTNQLKELGKATKNIATGNLNVDVPVKGHDELAEVAHAFNEMAINLRALNVKRNAAEHELQELNHSLESRVARRTGELEARNDQLLTANQAIKAAQKQLLQAEKMASLGFLAAGVAHEINNPMSFVISNITTLTDYLKCYQWLLKHYRALEVETELSKKEILINEIAAKESEFDMSFIEDDIDELLKDTLEGSLRVKEIVKGLKDFSHLESNDNHDLFDINQCIETTMKMTNNQTKYKCDVQTDLQPLPLTLIAPGKINQVLMNILLNASQAIVEKGLIRITSKVSEDKIIVEISDNGPGIDPEKVANIFDPFFTTKTVGEGTGLGLSISYNMIEEHGGHIYVESELNIGTTFTIELPITTHTIL